MAGIKYDYQHNATYTEFEIVNVREIVSTFDGKVKVEETILHYGGIQAKILAATKQHLDFFLWEIDRIFKKKNELIKLNNNKRKDICENDELNPALDVSF